MEEMDELNTQIAARLKALRLERRMTLDDLANASGVSRAMLSRVERAEASPTAVLLSRICAAFGLSLSSFFAETEKASDPLARRADQPVWRDPQTGYVRRAVSPPGSPARTDLVDVAFPASARLDYPALTGEPPMMQYVWLFSGQMEILANGQTHLLAAGDCLFMTLSDPHAFHNPGPGPAHYAVVVEKPK
jgi:transcriptional regulator with XRE-family HTH domain